MDSPIPDASRTATQGLLTIDADGNYVMLLACKAHPRGLDVGRSQSAALACNGNSPRSYAHSGRLRASASTIHFLVDYSSVNSLKGTDMSAHYLLDGKQLTLAFHSDEKEAWAGMAGDVVWQRLSAELPATPVVSRADECSLSHKPVPDRSDLNEIRVDQ